MTKMISSPSYGPCSSHGKGISSRRRSNRTLFILSILNMLVSFATAGPVFSKNFQVSNHIQAGRNIRHLPCKIKRSGDEGICMFAIDCLKSNGTHLGTCIDRFYFGSCCQIKDEHNVYLDHEINDNSIDGLLSNLVPATSKLPNSNNNLNYNQTSSSNNHLGSNGVTTSPGGEVTTIFLTDELTRKPTTKRPYVPVSSSSHKTASTTTTSHKTTTASSPISSTNFEMISVSSGVLSTNKDHGNKRPSTSTSNTKPMMSTGTTVFATLSTKLPSIVLLQNDIKTTSQRPSVTSSSSNPTTIAGIPLEAAASSAAVQIANNKNDEMPLQDTTSSMEMLEFTTFQSVNSAPPAAVSTTTRRPTSTTPRRPISVVTKKPTKFPFVTTTSAKISQLPPQRATTTKRPPIPQEPIFPQREPPILHNQISKPNSNTTRPRPPAPTTNTQRPEQTQPNDHLIQISISPPKATTRKPLPSKAPATKRPPLPTTTMPPTTTIKTRIPPTKPLATQEEPTTGTLQATEAFTTISYVETTRAPRPKPKPTADVEVVSNTGIEDLIAVEEGEEDEDLLTTTNIPLTKEDGVAVEATNDGNAGSGGAAERRTTTQKPVKITSVKVETTTSTTTTTTPTTTTTTQDPTPSSTTVKPPTTTTAERTTTISTTTTTDATTTTITSSSSTNTSHVPSAPTTTPTSGEAGIDSQEEEMTTLAEGIVTWTNVDLIEQGQKNATTEDPLTSQWVPLLTISSDDFKNTSTPIDSDDHTTPMTPTLMTTEGTSSFSPGLVTVVSSTTAPPSSVSSETPGPDITSDPGEDLSTDNKDGQLPATTVDTSAAPLSNETTTLSPDDLANVTTTTARPSFPSLEGIDYRMICGKRMFPEPRIVGGAMASFGRWPWQISLRQWRTSTYLHKCGAALLNENWAITAAHCVDNVPPSDLLLRLGEFDLAEEDEPYGYQERRVQIVASHPQFDPRTFEYDLALLRFYEPVVFQPNIIPVCVPENDENFIGRTAFVTGWGRLYEDGPLPSKLQEVSVPVIENKICETMYRSAGYIEHIPHIFICAGWKKGGYDSCEGDSGGPMVIQRDDKRFQLAGVISWGIGCAEPDQPGVYTRISEFRDWINQILQF